MPAIADITVKRNDTTTNIVYAAQTPSSGDGTPAVWKSTTVGTAQAHQPELRLSSREADGGAARELRGTYQYPQIATNTTTTVTDVVNRASASVTWKFPKGMAQADANEFASQFANLVASSLILSCVKSGYSAS
jgi:hypothetical protein